MIQLTLALKMTTAQVVETSVTVNNSAIQDYVHPDDDTQPTYKKTPGFKPFTENSQPAYSLKSRSRGQKKYDNVSPHHTKGMTTDSDNQIPTDYLFYNGIFNLWGQLSIILNRFNLFKRLTLITVLSSKSRVTCTPVASVGVGACCPILTGVFGTFINVYA